MEAIRAAEYAKYAKVGDVIKTPRYGEWRGGFAIITEILPDPEGAPDIVFQVEGLMGQGEIGVFDHEMIDVNDQ